MQGYEIIEICTDAGRSAKDIAKRPMLIRALNVACTEKAAFVAVKLDRVARSTIDALNIAERLRAAGTDFVMIHESMDTTTPHGKMIFSILAAFAEFERQITSQRTRDALDHKRRQGLVSGQVPFGYRRVGDTLVVDDAEWATIRRMTRWSSRGKTPSFIAARLNATGHRTRGAAGWSSAQVRRILLRIKRRPHTLVGGGVGISVESPSTTTLPEISHAETSA